MIDHVKPLRPRRIIGRGDVDEADELAGGIAAQMGQHIEDARRVGDNIQLAIFHITARHRARQGGGDGRAKDGEGIARGCFAILCVVHVTSQKGSAGQSRTTG